MMASMGNALQGVASGMLFDRIKRLVERASSVPGEKPHEDDSQILRDIRDLLMVIAGVDDPVKSRYYFTRLLTSYDFYPVQYEGREHLNLLSPAAFNLVFQIPGGIGLLTRPVVMGWNNLDVPEGTYIQTASGDPNRSVVIEYASYAHGVSI